MGDCHLTHYPNQIDDKMWPWGPACEMHFPRRRSRSETNDPCRRKVKEMKTLTPKKGYRSQEYENMDYECEVKEVKFECCRIRSNLCELPTSYISNNCQIPCNLTSTLTKLSHEPEFLENVTYENLGDMPSNTDNHSRISPIKFPYLKQPKRSSVLTAKTSINFPVVSDLKSQTINSFDCKGYCPVLDFKLHNLSDEKPLCYDTATYFNRRMESTNLKERYNVEVEYLRERLKKLKNTTYIESLNDTSAKPLIPSRITNHEPKTMAASTEIKLKVKREKKIVSPPGSKHSRRLALRTKAKVSHVKLKRSKSKLHGGSTSATSNCVESDVSDDTEDETNVDVDELDNTSEHSGLAAEASKESLDDKPSLGSQEAGSGDSVVWPVRQSLFPHIPPYITFRDHDSEGHALSPANVKLLKWKLSTITPIIIRKTLVNSGFALVRKSNTWLGTWGKHMKSPMFKTLKETQKLNHFPGTFQLGRKDRLWRNFQRMIAKFGYKEFGFLPHTYILPHELKLLKQNWDFTSDSKELWIIKPPASARGVGIKVISKWSHLPKKTSLVVQKYISNPYLINGSKFDLRLYVLVTSFHPLRIYLYPDGLARFASSKYTDDVRDIKDRYMHLTNYSINRLSTQYTANEDANACRGHKWTVSKLLEYLEKKGVDTKTLWKNLQALVIKTVIACEPPIVQLCEENMANKYNCYELFGVDVLLDENLKPWLLEVNISPSLHSASTLDAYVKGPMVRTLFDMALFHLPQRLSSQNRKSPPCFDPRIYTTQLTKKEKNKHAMYRDVENRERYLEGILWDLTGDDVRELTRAEDEYVAKGKFERIFPTAQTYKYLPFMEPRYYNKLFDAWETKYGHRREEGVSLLQMMCLQKTHLKVPHHNNTLIKNSPSTIRLEGNMQIQPSTEGQSYRFVDVDVIKEPTNVLVN